MMKKIATLSILSLLVLLVFSSKKIPAQGASKSALKTIIVDPGHGGSDVGARGDYSYEKDICLAVGLKVGKKLEQEIPDTKILYTRTTDSYPAIKARADFANSNKGDLFLSIHVNAAPKVKHSQFLGYKTQTYYTGKGKNRKKRTRKVPQYKVTYSDNPSRGTETFIWAADRTDEKEKFVGNDVASEELYDSTEFVPDLNDPEFKAKALLWTKKFFDKSYLLASMVEEEFVKEGRPSRGVKQRNEKGIWVLQATSMPSILVETGFITHAPDEAYLNSEKGQDRIAENIVNAVKRFREIYK